MCSNEDLNKVVYILLKLLKSTHDKGGQCLTSYCCKSNEFLVNSDRIGSNNDLRFISYLPSDNLITQSSTAAAIGNKKFKFPFI